VQSSSGPPAKPQRLHPLSSIRGHLDASPSSSSTTTSEGEHRRGVIRVAPRWRPGGPPTTQRRCAHRQHSLLAEPRPQSRQAATIGRWRLFSFYSRAEDIKVDLGFLRLFRSPLPPFYWSFFRVCGYAGFLKSLSFHRSLLLILIIDDSVPPSEDVLYQTVDLLPEARYLSSSFPSSRPSSWWYWPAVLMACLTFLLVDVDLLLLACCRLVTFELL
jgi:hypothetical protein